MAGRNARHRGVLLLLMAASLAAGMVALGRGATVAHAWNPSQAPAIERRLWDAAADFELNYQAPPETPAQPRDAPKPDNYFPSGPANVCGDTIGGNVKVDQGCLNVSAPGFFGRGQAHNETAIAVNPLNDRQLLAASNDYKLGDGIDGGTEYSNDGGRTWANSEVPLEFTRGSDFGSSSPNNQCATLNPNPTPPARMYWQGGGDPSVAWDTEGNAYFAGLHFNRGSPPLGVSDNPDYSSGVYVHRSTENGGASWSFPGTAVVTCYQPTTPQLTGVPLEDKPYMAIDDSISSPFRDRIYVTWTLFAADGTAYIYEAHSSDYARHFSAPVLVSKDSSLCPNNYATFGVAPENGNNCDENQFSDPFVGPDGSLYVVFDNFNTTTATASSGDNKTQVLLEKSSDGGVSFGAPVQVGFYYDLPDCGTYQGGQDELRACVPEQGSQQESVFRATNVPSGAVSPTDSARVEVSYGSYINRDSNTTTGCSPNGTDPDVFTQLYNGVKTEACANKILVSVSSNAGASFSATGADPRTVTVVPQDETQKHRDQWWQWAAFDQAGDFVVSYYDRAYGDDITTGNMDITLSRSTGDGSTFTPSRVTSSSMPIPTEFPDAQGNSVFFGDYTGLAVGGNVAHPLWMDTREPDLIDCGGTGPPAVCTFISPGSGDDPANNEDIFTAGVNIRR